MKNLILVFVSLLISGMISGQAINSDDILGVWLNEDKDAHVEIYKEGDQYFGKIVWLKFPIDEETGKPKVDDENPDEDLRDQPVLGLVLLKDFVFDRDEWDSGSIYDPKNGKTYDCYMELKDEDNLKIRGYIGISLLGRTTYWTRVKED